MNESMLHLLIAIFIVLIVLSLLSGLVFLVRDRGRGDRTVKALTWRIGLSIVLFLLIMLSWWSGQVPPRGL